MATLVATEEFPFNVTVTPKVSAPAVVKANKLANGVQVVTRTNNSSTVSLKFAVLGGSSTEGAAKGAAHFLSHAALAGTQNSTGLQLVKHLESLGASFESHADREKIVYDVRVLPDKAEAVIEAVVSAIASPPHAPYLLEEVRAKAQVDYNKFAVDRSAQLQELLFEAAYGDSPLGSSRFASNLKKLSVADVLKYRATHFVRGNVVVVGNGIGQEQLEAAINKSVTALPDGPAVALPASTYVGGDVKVRTDLDGASLFGLAFPVPSGDASKPFKILNALIGEKLASQNVCAKNFIHSFAAGGIFGVEAGAPQHLQLVADELKAIAAKSPSIDAIKQKLTLEHFLALEGADSTGSLLAAHQRGVAAPAAGDLRNVTPEAVSAAAAATLKANPSYVVLGATTGTPTFAAISKLLR